MISSRRTLFRIGSCHLNGQIRGKRKLPLSYDDITIPEASLLPEMDKAPTYPPDIEPPTMRKMRFLQRGPELVHNKLIHKQFGVQAICGGFLEWKHMETIRIHLHRFMNPQTMFAVWRVDPPWQAKSRKAQGHAMGGGKGPISHYMTPVRSGRIILELGGHCEFEEVKRCLKGIAHILPFPAIAVSQRIMEQRAKLEKWREVHNTNPYTAKYVMQNNLGGCWKWMGPMDFLYFGKYP